MKKYHKSLKVHLIYTICVVCVPIFITMFFMINISISLIQNRIYQDSMEMLGMNRQLMDGELQKVANYFQEKNVAVKEVEGLLSGSQINVYNSTIITAQEMEEVLSRFRYVDNIVCYLPKTNQCIYRFTEKSRDFLMRENVKNEIKEHPEEFYGSAERWENKNIGDTDILTCYWGNEDIILCAWTTYDSLLTLTQNWDGVDGSYYCITSTDGKVYTPLPKKMKDLSFNFNKETEEYYFSEKQNGYLLIGVNSEQNDFRIVKIVSRRKLLGVFWILRILNIILAAGVAGFLIPYLLQTLRQYIFKPIEQMEVGIAEIEKGDLSVRIPETDSSLEMEHLMRSFNKMVSRIGELKIQNYEEKMKHQKLMLDYMAIQIEPHFYLNALNLINTMAQMRDTELIQRMTENLSLYLRYITSSRNKVVTIRQELEHIKHYMNIMVIRFGDCFCYDEKVDPDLLECQIPPLLIQTIVENSMKYAFDFYGDTRIKVEIGSEEEKNRIMIRISDNGNGYPEEILNKFAEDRPMEGSHIGLWNAKMRLKHLYPETSEFLVSNANPGGAVTTIYIKRK